MPMPEPAAAFMARQIERLRRSRVKRRIVFPEGGDARVQRAAARLASEGILEPILVGEPPAMAPSDRYAGLYLERRRAKGITRMEAARIASDPLHFAALMLAAGHADGFVGSAVYTTAETVRAIIHSIELGRGFRKLSSAHVMAGRDRRFGHDGLLIFSDAAIIAVPSAVELAEIAIASAATARGVLDTEPAVALLSFSTKGSAQHKEAHKVAAALKYVHERAPELNADGELQADAALVAAVGRSKAPGSTVTGRANTLVFPDLNSANIGYKLVERLGGGALLAVLLQGIARPASLISRGCSADDAYNAAIVTAVQADRSQAAAV